MGRLELALQLGLLALVLTYPATSQDPGLDLPVSPETFIEPAPWIDPPEDPRDEPAPIFYGEEIESENSTIVYVIDISGSMRRDDRIGRAKQETIRSIQGLSPAIRFNVVAFSCQVSNWRNGLYRADAGNKASACAWVNSLTASGGTATGPGVSYALADRQVMSVALLTDGAPGCGAYGPGETRTDSHRKMINSNNLQRAVVNVFGIDAYGDYRSFCQSVASDSGGSYFDVP